MTLGPKNSVHEGRGTLQKQLKQLCSIFGRKGCEVVVCQSHEGHIKRFRNCKRGKTNKTVRIVIQFYIL